MHHYQSKVLTNCNEWAARLLPLCQVIEDRLRQWIQKLSNAMRKGWHENTAFALKMILEVCHHGYFPSLQAIAMEKSIVLFGKDQGVQDPQENCPFLSPSMCEADLMMYIHYHYNAFTAEGPLKLVVQSLRDSTTGFPWLSQAIDKQVWGLQPNHDGDPEDGYKSHLCGLNFSRSYNLSSIASCLLNDPQLIVEKLQNTSAASTAGSNIIAFVSKLVQSALDHYNFAVPSLATGHFMGDHWLASFAVRARTALLHLQASVDAFYLWMTIYQQMNAVDNQDQLVSTAQVAPAARPWTAIRVFVSSTFADMHHEREILIKQVFPAVSKWAEKLKVKIIPVDLRWGVPKDATSQEILTACLTEIDRCRLLGGNGLFLGMLSERYGWVCSTDSVPELIRQKYEWIDGCSVTQMEILHGALRSQSNNACFLLRDPRFVQDIPPSQMRAFVDPTHSDQAKLHQLKTHLRGHFPSENVHSYPCRVKNIDHVGKVQFEGLNHQFAGYATEFLKRRISELFPEPIPLAPEVVEEQAHLDFLHSRGSFVLGRDEDVLQILSYFDTIRTNENNEEAARTLFQMIDLDGQGTLDKNELIAYFKSLVHNISEIDIWAMILHNCSAITEEQNELTFDAFVDFYEHYFLSWSHPYTVIGEAGCGKSTVICKAINDFISLHAADSSEWIVISHFVGSTPGSTFVERLVMRIGRALEGPAWKPPLDQEELMKALPNILLRASMKGKRVAIFIDALNQLDDTGSAHDLHWLPHWLPPNIKIVVSVLESNCLNNLIARTPSAAFQSLKVLKSDVSEQIVEHFLAEYNKRLDSTQMKLLLNKKDASNPQYLRVACNELRVFGVFELVTNRIASLSEDLAPLYSEVIQRLVEDYGELMLLTLCIIQRSRHGVLESELLEILGDHSLRRAFDFARVASTEELLQLEADSDANQLLAEATEDFKANNIMDIATENGADNDLEGKGKSSLEIENKKRELLPANEWAVIIAALGEFVGVISVDGRLDFYHRSFAKAVRRICMNQDDNDDVQEGDGKKDHHFVYEDKKLYKKPAIFFHGVLANYFESLSTTDTVRKTQELPFHLMQLLDNNRLLQSLLDWNMFESLYSSNLSKTKLFEYWREVGGYGVAETLYTKEVEQWTRSGLLSTEELIHRKELIGMFFVEVGQWLPAQKFFEEVIAYREQSLSGNSEDVFQNRLALVNTMMDLLVMLNFYRNVDPAQRASPYVIQYADTCLEVLQPCFEMFATLSKEDIQRVECKYAQALQIRAMNKASLIFQIPPNEVDASLQAMEQDAAQARELFTKYHDPMIAQVNHSDAYISLAHAYFSRRRGDANGFRTWIQKSIDDAKRAYYGYRTWLGDFTPKTAECCMSIAIYCEWANDAKQALEWSKRSAELFQGSVGEGHPIAQRNQEMLTRTLQKF